MEVKDSMFDFSTQKPMINALAVRTYTAVLLMKKLKLTMRFERQMKTNATTHNG